MIDGADIMFNKLKKSNNKEASSQQLGRKPQSQLKSNSFPVQAAARPEGRNDSPSASSVPHPPASSYAPRNAAAPVVVAGGGAGVGVGVGPSYQDQPETDYDLGPTELYTHIENKRWEAAIERSSSHPVEVRTWISRREPDDRNRIRWRLLPLHATCVFRAPLSLIDALLSSYPDAPGCVDDQGMLPIHLACRNGASRGVVTTLLNAHPPSVRARDKKGRSPLDLVENSNSQNKDAVVEAMRAFAISLDSNTLPASGVGLRAVSPAVAGALIPPPPLPSPAAAGGGISPAPPLLPSPAAAGNNNSVGNNNNGGNNDVSTCEREVDYENRTILFRLVLKKDWDGVLSRVRLFPSEACTWIVTKGFNGNLRFLPIHKACVLGPPPAVVSALMSAFPEGAARADQDGWLPLHCACFYSSPDATLDAIIRSDPRAASRKDDDGRLPLHYACLKGASVDAVSMLLGAHARGALTKDNDGRTPLHHACSKGAVDAVIESLVLHGPKAAQSKDANGRLPLHLACKRGASKASLTCLLRVYARGAASKDDQEKLPVHHACQSGSCSPACVLALLDAHPESIRARTAFGLTPHDEARQPKSNNEDDHLGVGSIIEVLDRFEAEQDRLGMGRGGDASNNGGTGGSGMDAARVRELENRVVELTNQTDILLDALGDIGHMAAQLKADLVVDSGGGGGGGGGGGSTATSTAAFARFCDNLMGLSLGGRTA